MLDLDISKIKEKICPKCDIKQLCIKEKMKENFLPSA
jgi:hypothetical protein